MTRSRLRLLVTSTALSTIVISTLLPAAASAQEGEAWGSRAGTSYLGAGFSFGAENFDRDDASNVDDAYGGSFWLGYRWSDAWAVETQVELLEGFDLTIAPLDGDGQYVAATLNAKFFPLAHILPSRIDPFLFVGAGVGRIQVSVGSTSDIEEIAFLARAGGGVDVYVTEKIALQLSTSYVQPTQDLNDFSYVSTIAGLQYRF